ncbi:hypothetical protein [Desulfogranum marinum]
MMNIKLHKLARTTPAIREEVRRSNLSAQLSGLEAHDRKHIATT